MYVLEYMRTTVLQLIKATTGRPLRPGKQTRELVGSQKSIYFLLFFPSYCILQYYVLLT
jgi:hypothetical protein